MVMSWSWIFNFFVVNAKWVVENVNQSDFYLVIDQYDAFLEGDEISHVSLSEIISRLTYFWTWKVNM